MTGDPARVYSFLFCCGPGVHRPSPRIHTRWASVLTLRYTFLVQGFIRDSQPGASGGLEFHEIKANILTPALFLILLDRVLLRSQVALSLMIDSHPQRAG